MNSGPRCQRMANAARVSASVAASDSSAPFTFRLFAAEGRGAWRLSCSRVIIIPLRRTLRLSARVRADAVAVLGKEGAWVATACPGGAAIAAYHGRGIAASGTSLLSLVALCACRDTALAAARCTCGHSQIAVRRSGRGHSTCAMSAGAGLLPYSDDTSTTRRGDDVLSPGDRVARRRSPTLCVRAD